MKPTTSNNDPLRIVDSSQPVTQDLIESVSAYYGQLPVAWGRYFTTTYPVEYAHNSENDILHDHKIKLLPIARHTNHVGGSFEQGERDAKEGVDDLFATFTIDYWKAQGKEFLFFLDVEGVSDSVNGSISKAYYRGWSQTLIKYSKEKSANAVTILPCVYANYHDDTTFDILIKNDLTCYGLWIARYHNTPEKWPSWDENFAIPPAVQNSSIPVFLRQYASDIQINEPFDLDQTNPNITNIQKRFLDKLILPPSKAIS